MSHILDVHVVTWAQVTVVPDFEIFVKKCCVTGAPISYTLGSEYRVLAIKCHSSFLLFLEYNSSLKGKILYKPDKLKYFNFCLFERI